jgi:hypothetical protein
MTELNICEICLKEFSNKFNLKKHKEKVKKCKFSENKNLSLLQKYVILENNYDLITEQYKNLKQEHELLKQKYDNLDLEYKDNLKKNYENKANITYNTYNNSNNSNTNNNNLSVKQIVSKLEPITDNTFKDSLQYLNNDVLESGLKGFAQFLCNYPYNQKFITTDVSRKIISYRTNINDFIKDPECLQLLNNTLKENSEQILKIARERRDELGRFIEDSEDTEEIQEMAYRRDNIHELILLTKNAVKNNVNTNIRSISDILVNHGVENYNNQK